MNREEKIIRIQADKLCGYLGLEAGTKIPEYLIDLISRPGEYVILDGKEIRVTPTMRGIATIIMEKIRK